MHFMKKIDNKTACGRKLMKALKAFDKCRTSGGRFQSKSSPKSVVGFHCVGRD